MSYPQFSKFRAANRLLFCLSFSNGGPRWLLFDLNHRPDWFPSHLSTWSTSDWFKATTSYTTITQKAFQKSPINVSVEMWPPLRSNLFCFLFQLSCHREPGSRLYLQVPLTLSAWLIDLLIDWLIDWFDYPFIYRLFAQLIGFLYWMYDW